MTYFISLAVIALAVILLGLITIKRFKSEKTNITRVSTKPHIAALHIEGLPIVANEPCNIIRFKNRVQIESGNVKFQIPISNIRVAEVKTAQELANEKNGVVNSSVIGTLLVPGLNTIVRSIPKVGSRKKNSNNTYFIMNYTNTAGELDAVTFKNCFNVSGANRFCAKINKFADPSYFSEAIQL